jgi:hypothetical protein
LCDGISPATTLQKMQSGSLMKAAGYSQSMWRK